MTYDFRYQNPKELGIIRLEKVKCGKPNCHCAKGKKHKAYYLYYRDYDEYHPNAHGHWRAKLKKKYIPKSEVKKWRRKIQLRKNEDKLRKLYDKDEELFNRVWEKLGHLPKSKIVERFHTVLKRVKKISLLTQPSSLLRSKYTYKSGFLAL